MKTKWTIVCIMILWMGILPQWVGAADSSGDTPKPSASSLMPKAVAVNPLYDFGTVFDGVIVLHDFVIENQGHGKLLIQKVIPDCGCTTVEHPESIEPGDSGIIRIRSNTKGYGGMLFSKSTTVETNDPVNSRIHLRISGHVENFVTITPRRVILQGHAGDAIEKVVSIVPDKKYPFDILEISTVRLKDLVDCHLEKQNGAYKLTVRNLMKTSGQYKGLIQIKINSHVKSQLDIPVNGFIQDSSS